MILNIRVGKWKLVNFYAEEDGGSVLAIFG